MKNLTTDDVLDIICFLVLVAGIVASAIFKFYSQIGYIIIAIMFFFTGRFYKKETIRLKERIKELGGEEE